MKLLDMMSDEVKAKLHRKTCSQNETILFAENENDYVFFLIEGVAKAYIPSLQGVFSNIYIYEPGASFVTHLSIQTVHCVGSICRFLGNQITGKELSLPCLGSESTNFSSCSDQLL